MTKEKLFPYLLVNKHFLHAVHFLLYRKITYEFTVLITQLFLTICMYLNLSGITAFSYLI